MKYLQLFQLKALKIKLLKMYNVVESILNENKTCVQILLKIYKYKTT